MEKPFPGRPAEPDEEKLVMLGTLSKPQGLKGGVRMWPQFDNPDDFEELKTDRVFLKTVAPKASLRPRASRFYELTVDEFTTRQRFLVLNFDGVEDPETAELLRDCELYVYEDELWDLPEGEFYTYELVGLRVVDDEDGAVVGKVIEVQPGVQDYLLVQPEGEGAKGFLVPYVPEIVSAVDIKSGEIRVRLPEGLDSL